MWLDADTLIREKSGGKRSLDDFAQAFFGVNNGSFVPITYVFDDVVKALNAVQPYDWATFLRARLDGHGPGAPLDGLARGGYKLVYTDTPVRLFQGLRGAPQGHRPDLFAWHDRRRRRPAQRRAVGRARLQERADRRHADHRRQRRSPLTPTGSRARSKTPSRPSAAIELLVKNGDRFRTVKIDYHDGLRYPHLNATTVPPRA